MALCAAQECIFIACVSDNAIYCIKPGEEPIWFSGNFLGVSKIVDMTVGPENSLICACQGLGDDGLLWVISCYGVPTVCLGIKGLP